MKLIELCQKGVRESLADNNLFLPIDSAEEIVEESE